MEMTYFPKGKVIYEEGWFGREFYLVIMGKVTLYIQHQNEGRDLKKFRAMRPKCFEKANGVLQDTYEFMKMKPGDSFGESSLMNDKPLQESVL